MKFSHTCVRTVKALNWRHRGVTRRVLAAGRKATVAMTTTVSTMIDSSQDPMNHVIVQLADTAHVPVDVMHMYLKTVFAFLAVFVTL